MEEFKSLENVMKKYHSHVLVDAVAGNTNFTLENWHADLADEALNECVPDEIKSQFNIVRNMALYSYFCYGLVIETMLKSYIVIEYALRIKYDQSTPGKKRNAIRSSLKNLINFAVQQGWICDAGFRVLKKPAPGNTWCKDLPDVISGLRNSFAHGSNSRTHDCQADIMNCADFINQLFPDDKK